VWDQTLGLLLTTRCGAEEDRLIPEQCLVSPGVLSYCTVALEGQTEGQVGMIDLAEKDIKGVEVAEEGKKYG